MTIVTDMKIASSMKIYKTPQIKVFEVNVRGVLCQSQAEGNTERYQSEGYKYNGDDIFE